MPSPSKPPAAAYALLIGFALLLAACAAMAPQPPAKPLLRVPVAATDIAAQLAVEELAGRFLGVDLKLDASAGSGIDAWARKLCALPDGLGRIAAKHVLSGPAPKTVYVLSETTAREAAAGETFRAAMQAAGVRVALATVVHEGERDFSPALNRAAVDKPGLIFFAGKPEVAALFLQQLKERRLDTPLLLADSHGRGGAIPGAATLTAVPPLALLPEATTFVSAYQTKAGRAPDWPAACTYDATRAWLTAAAAARKARGGALPTAEEVEAQRAAVDFVGATGPVAFAAQGQRKTRPHVLLIQGPNGPQRVAYIAAEAD